MSKTRAPVLALLAALAGCMDPLHDYGACVDIETARCDKRASCRGDASFEESFGGFDRDTCVAYAKEHCRTREIKGPDTWTARDVQTCVTAIKNKVQCADLDPGVDETETVVSAECWFIEAPAQDDAESETTASEESSASASDTTTSTAGDTGESAASVSDTGTVTSSDR